MSASIAKDKVVSIHYRLTDSDGKELDRSGDGDPLVYLHGADNIVPGLEKELDGRTVGDKLVAVVAPEDGYGKKHKTKPQPVPRSAFPKDAHVEVGASFVVQGPDGRPHPVWVSKVQGPTVYIDANHPLAGVTLHFDVEVVEVRDATQEELEHGHPHGPGGHH